VNLLVPDVDYDGHQQGSDVKKLSEYARLWKNYYFGHTYIRAV
jgi:hypothetical protein